MQNKHLYVIKSVQDTRGRGVYIGRNILSDEWENLANNTVDAPYIIQEYVDCKKTNVLSPLNKQESMYSTLGMFILQGKATGILVRSSQNEITNVVGKTGCIRASYIIKN